MNYRHVYMEIIFHAKQEMKLGLRPKNRYYKSKNFPNQYFEFHHILPRSLFPLWIKRESNIVTLTAKEHFFCHQLLTKIYPNSFEMKSAIWRMICRVKELKISSKQYEKIRKDFSKELSDKRKGIQTKSTLGKHWFTDGKKNVCTFICPENFRKGKTLSKESILNIRVKNSLRKGSKHSVKSRLNMSLAARGKEKPWLKGKYSSYFLCKETNEIQSWSVWVSRGFKDIITCTKRGWRCKGFYFEKV